jgi:hypothetical protein
VQLSSNKALSFKGVQGIAGRIDLMIVDISEGLLVSMVSSPPTSVIEWNSEDKNFLPMVFDFGNSLVHDNGVLLFFHNDDLKLRGDIRGFAKAYHFKILKKWTGINCLPITSAKDASKTMNDSCLVT